MNLWGRMDGLHCCVALSYRLDTRLNLVNAMWCAINDSTCCNRGLWPHVAVAAERIDHLLRY